MIYKQAPLVSIRCSCFYTEAGRGASVPYVRRKRDYSVHRRCCNV